MNYNIDATNQSLGRLASRIAILLRGKHLASFQGNKLPEHTVTVLNVDKVKFTGSKFKDKLYHRYSGYPGGLRSRTLEQLWQKDPGEVIRQSVYRMMPTNRSRDKIIQNIRFK